MIKIISFLISIIILISCRSEQKPISLESSGSDESTSVTAVTRVPYSGVDELAGVAPEMVTEAKRELEVLVDDYREYFEKISMEYRIYESSRSSEVEAYLSKRKSMQLEYFQKQHDWKVKYKGVKPQNISEFMSQNWSAPQCLES